MLGARGGYGGKKPDWKGEVKKTAALVIPKPINLPSRRKENNGFDPNIQLVPGGSWTGPNRPGTGPPPGAAPQQAAPPQGVRPQGPPANGIGGHTFSSGGWASGGNNAAASPSSVSGRRDFPELGAPEAKPAVPPAAVPARPGVPGTAPTNGVAPVSASTARWAVRSEEPMAVARSARVGLDKDWAEDDDDDGMDFSKPIVIKRQDEDKANAASAGPALVESVPMDPREEAKMLAMKRAAQLERMQEDMESQMRNQERQALLDEKRHEEEREEERRREQEQRAQMMEKRRREQDEAMAKHRAEAEARRAEELARREEEAKKREEAERQRAEEMEKLRLAEKEAFANQQQKMRESVEAAKVRRQREEEEAEQARKARAAERLAELDRKAAERARVEIPPAQQQQAQGLERGGVGNGMARQKEATRLATRSSAWNQQPLDSPDPEVERAQWAALRKDNRPDPRPPAPARPQGDSRGGSNQTSYDSFGFGSRGGASMGFNDRGHYSSQYNNMSDANSRGGHGGPRQLNDPRNGRFVVDDVGQNLRKQMAEREEREAKEAARKEELARGPNREELKKMALGERRKREADRRAREPEVAPEEIQNADPQRGSALKGKLQARARGQGNATQHSAVTGVNLEADNKEEVVDDAMAMPINDEWAPWPQLQSGANFAGGVWGSSAKPVLMFDDKQADGLLPRGSRGFQQSRSPDKSGVGDEGDRGKMQDDTEVAARTAVDFVLEDEHSPEKMDGMMSGTNVTALAMDSGSIGSFGWQPSAPNWGAATGCSMWGDTLGTLGGPSLPFGTLGGPSLPFAAPWENFGNTHGNTQWDVPQNWSAQPQTSLQTDVPVQASNGSISIAEKAEKSIIKAHVNQGGKNKQPRDPKSARGQKGAGQKKDQKDQKEHMDTTTSAKGDDHAASVEQVSAGGLQTTGRGAGKGARGGHSASSNTRNKQQRVAKSVSAGDGETSGAGEHNNTTTMNKEGTAEANAKPAGRARGPKPGLVSLEIKQRAQALIKEKEAASQKLSGDAAQ